MPFCFEFLYGACLRSLAGFERWRVDGVVLDLVVDGSSARASGVGVGVVLVDVQETAFTPKLARPVLVEVVAAGHGGLAAVVEVALGS